MLRAAPNFSWANHSVPVDDPLHGGTESQLRQGLARQMRSSSIILAISGIYASHSDWMQEEIELAIGFDKPIVGLIPWGNQRVSRAVESAAIAMVGWNSNSIISAIREHSL